MSKTDKTAPMRVRVLNKPTHLTELHDHTSGGCDLPVQRTLSEAGATRCVWVQSDSFWDDKENWCGCPFCADQVGRKAKTRSARYGARRYSRGGWTRDYV